MEERAPDVGPGATPRPVVGYVPGVFDMFHVGHLNIFRQAREHCDELVAGVVSDEHAAAVKGRPPVIPLHERLEIVRHCVLVDRAVPELASKVDMWDQLRFHVIFKGDDWRGTAKGEALEEAFRPLGVRVAYFPYTVHTSSTILRDALDRLRAS